MESITSVRNALFSAFILAIGAIALLLLFPFERQWILWSARVGAGLVSIFAIAAITVLFITYFPANEEDPWKSSYFRYMRNLWGYKWGGWSHPFRISVCPAVCYTWITLFLWFLFVGALGFLTYHALVIGIGGFEASPFWTGEENRGEENRMVNLVGIIIFFGIFFGFLGNMVMYVLFAALFSKPANLSSRTNAMFGTWMLILAFLTIGVAPIHSFGAMAVGRVVIWSVIAVAGGTFVFWLLFAIVMALFKGIKGLRHTAPGQLFSEVHETLCPEIVEKLPLTKEELA